LIATNKNDRWIFIYGFAKNDSDNINRSEERSFKRSAQVFLEFDNIQLNKAIIEGELIEVKV